MPAHVRKGDDVIITAGQFRGQTGKVLSVDPGAQRVVVKGPGIRGVVRTVKPNRINPKGGQVEVDRDFHMSNVSPVVDGKATRVRFQTKSDGSKVRVAVRGGSELSVLRRGDSAGKKTKAGAKAAGASTPGAKKTTRKKAPAGA